MSLRSFDCILIGLSSHVLSSHFGMQIGKLGFLGDIQTSLMLLFFLLTPFDFGQRSSV